MRVCLTHAGLFITKARARTLQGKAAERVIWTRDEWEALRERLAIATLNGDLEFIAGRQAVRKFTSRQIALGRICRTDGRLKTRLVREHSSTTLPKIYLALARLRRRTSRDLFGRYAAPDLMVGDPRASYNDRPGRDSRIFTNLNVRKYY
jgi:hypothetical protein